MNFFKRKTTWTNFEFGFMKICLVSLGIFIGIWLHKAIAAYAVYFLITYIVMGLIGMYLWFTKMGAKD